MLPQTTEHTNANEVWQSIESLLIDLPVVRSIAR